jgi:hypothetical protein
VQKLEACLRSHERLTVMVPKHRDSFTFLRKLQSIEMTHIYYNILPVPVAGFDCSIGRLTDY